RVQRLEETEKTNGAHKARSLDWYYDDDGKLLFLRPDGMPLPEVPAPTPATEDLAEWVRMTGLHVSAETCVPDWRGERLDLDLAVLGLLQSDGRMGSTPTALGSAS
ncbi:MAG: hypothetical protein O7H40_00205, partial [Gammaproteobacteria bacterium]|nr:hypothetical protein [Gammaproteobacteria bacterium]